eukprot:TRINITY_DN300_c0_g1_i1.p1 TRINITY_DN300_c0_g1~~TRINITY_DN300_c0_g1_i1.p1  ORF type:complete len:398 (+),score=49.72 TRINITY_DN300_c0_g1_i1:111-1304(+)
MGGGAFVRAAVIWLALVAAIHAADFTCIVLGPQGGADESRASSFLFKPANSPAVNGFLSVESGSMLSSLQVALEANAFHDQPRSLFVNTTSNYEKATQIQRTQIKAYVISHPHIDHNLGLVMSSQSDAAGKTIYGTNETLNYFSSSIMNNVAWPNLADRGANGFPMYHLQGLDETIPTALPLNFSAVAMPVTHGKAGSVPYNSSAFFISLPNNKTFLYWGDVGPDSVQTYLPRNYLVWQRAAPLIVAKKLDTIFIECSYDNSRADGLLFGHLTPRYVLQELTTLANYVNPAKVNNSLAGVTVVIVHIKAGLPGMGNIAARLQSQLQAGNNLGVKFHLPKAGARFDFGSSPLRLDAESVTVDLCATTNKMTEDSSASSRTSIVMYILDILHAMCRMLF